VDGAGETLSSPLPPGVDQVKADAKVKVNKSFAPGVASIRSRRRHQYETSRASLA